MIGVKTYLVRDKSKDIIKVVEEPSTHTFVVKEGEPIKYIVMRDGYKTIEETVTLTSDMTIDVVMEKDGPLYACYYDEYYYYYAKTPIGSDMKIYHSEDTRESPAFNIGNLISGGSWESLTEELGVDKHGEEYPRYYEGDLYE